MKQPALILGLGLCAALPYGLCRGNPSGKPPVPGSARCSPRTKARRSAEPFLTARRSMRPLVEGTIHDARAAEPGSRAKMKVAVTAESGLAK